MLRFGPPLAALLGPMVVFLAIIILVPFVYMLWLSLTNLGFATTDQTGSFVGAANYERAFARDTAFHQSIFRSLAFAALCVFPQAIAGLAVTEFLYFRPKLQKLITPILLIPLIPALLPVVVVGLALLEAIASGRIRRLELYPGISRNSRCAWAA